MEDIQIADWLMLSRLYQQRQQQHLLNKHCDLYGECSVCRKNRMIEYEYRPQNNSHHYQHSKHSLLHPPKLLRILPDDVKPMKTRIFTPDLPSSTYNSSNENFEENRIMTPNFHKRKLVLDEERETESKRSRIFYYTDSYYTDQYTKAISTPPMTPPMTPPSPSFYQYSQPKLEPQTFDCVSSSDEEEKPFDQELHKKEVERAKYERTIKLYKFLIDLLEAENPCVVWITRETGIFKIKDSEKLAKLWGKVKLNPTMNYEKLARSFRHYYKKGILDSGTTLSKCGKRKLYYKFSAQMLKKYLNI